MGVPCSLTCTRFYALIALQGSLPDIKCETEVNIVFSSFLEKCKYLNCECPGADPDSGHRRSTFQGLIFLISKENSDNNIQKIF